MDTYTVTVEHRSVDTGEVVTDTVEVVASSHRAAYQAAVKVVRAQLLVDAAEAGFWNVRSLNSATLARSLHDINAARDEG